MTWSKRFAEPIVLPDGRRLTTLQDAANYIASLPTEQSNSSDWKLAMEALTLAAERRDYEQLARAIVMKALEPMPTSELPTPRTVH